MALRRREDRADGVGSDLLLNVDAGADIEQRVEVHLPVDVDIVGDGDGAGGRETRGKVRSGLGVGYWTVRC